MIEVEASADLALGIGARFRVLVNGNEVGTAVAGASTKSFTFDAPTTANDRVEVVFDNDFWIRGVADRNLTIDRVTVDGTSTAGRTLYSAGSLVVQPGSGPTDAVFEPDQIVVEARADVANGKGAAFSVLVDGEKIGGDVAGTSFGRFIFDLDAPITAEQRVEIVFTNDYWNPSAGLDRNLIVEHVIVGGAEIDGTKLWRNGPFVAQAGAPTLLNPNDPLPPIEESGLGVALVEYASLPRSGSGAVNRIQQLVTADDGSDRFYSVDTRGEVLVIEDGTVRSQPFLDLPSLNAGFTEVGNEGGLRSLAFHPDFANPGSAGYGKVYTVYPATPASRPADVKLFDVPGGADVVRFHDVVAEWTVPDPEAPFAVDPDSRRELFRLEERFTNHNLNQLLFNPNSRPGNPDYGRLYVGVGDGGSGGDPFDLAQDLGQLQGKVLRLDPLAGANGDAYAIPGDNPFAGTPGALGEIWAYGLRNPQTLSFDSEGRGRLFAGDIGQNQVEEIDVILRGANYGWNEREGTFRYEEGGGLSRLPANDAAFGYQYPLTQYDHAEIGGGAAIAGGFVYRGDAIPQLQGQYLFSDLVSGRIFHVPVDARLEQALKDGRIAPGEGVTLEELTLFSNGAPVTLLDIVGANRVDLRFGADDDGELYVFSKQSGTVWQLEALPANAEAASASPFGLTEDPYGAAIA